MFSVKCSYVFTSIGFGCKLSDFKHETWIRLSGFIMYFAVCVLPSANNDFIRYKINSRKCTPQELNGKSFHCQIVLLFI